MAAVRTRGGRPVVAAVAVFLAAVALQRACTTAWASGRAGDGSTVQLTAVGVSVVSPSGVRQDCRWWPRYGDAALCAPATAEDPVQAAHRRLRAAYPLLQVGLWLAVASLLLQTLRVPRHPWLQAAPPAIIAVLSSWAIAILWRGAPMALVATREAALHFRGLGFIGAVAAVGLASVSAILLVTAPRHAPPA